MELSHLLKLVSELPPDSTLNYVRGTDTCKFVDVDINGQRINSVAPNGEDKSWAPSYLAELAPKIYENEPFNLSGLLNNRGSYRPVLETIIAHTREFYTVKKGTATALVWIPSKPKSHLELEEIEADEIPAPFPHDSNSQKLLSREELIQKVRESFVKYWNIIDQHGAQFELYVSKFESTLNPILQKLDLGIADIFEVVNYTQYCAIIDAIIEADTSLAYLKDEKGPDGNRYYIWSTNRHFRNFLEILSFSDFFSNIREQEKNTISVVASTADVEQSYLRAMRTKPFLLLAGISGTGKSRIVKEMAFDSCPDNLALRQDPTSPGNYCLVEVKPNWHDSTELLGYESKIGGSHFVVTPFVKFLAKAMLYEDTPFFVCLDEMNLAPVEQYFAEFLSVLESRKLVGDKITSEPLIKPSIFVEYEKNLKPLLFDIKPEAANYDGKTTSDVPIHYGKENTVYEILKEKGLRIPANVIVIGTVNMDETTHQFSRKVIDRAMTIEMNLPEGDPFMDFYDSRELGYRETPVDASLYLPSKVSASEALEELSEADSDKTEWLKEEIAKVLTNLNSQLEDTPFKIAYRVQNELVLYFFELWRENKSMEWSDLLNNAVDQILMMKVLPRVEGDEDLLEKPLNRLADFCAPYPNATKKVQEMKTRLNGSHFTSYWP